MLSQVIFQAVAFREVWPVVAAADRGVVELDWPSKWLALRPHTTPSQRV
jgi:hypothetical protein